MMLDGMRTTLVIDDDVLSAAKELAAMEKKSVGEVISSLARRALSPGEAKAKTRNGVPLLKVRKGAPLVTSDSSINSGRSCHDQVSARTRSSLEFIWKPRENLLLPLAQMCSRQIEPRAALHLSRSSQIACRRRPRLLACLAEQRTRAI